MRSPAGRRGETTEPDGIWFRAIGSPPRTTTPYDRTKERLTQDEVKKD